MNNLFVYGTLQYGQSRNYMLKGLAFERAVLMGYEKHEPPSLGFPYIILNEEARVKGEVYFDVSDSLLRKIDIIEDEGNLYHRIVVRLITTSEQELEAFTYYPSQDLQGILK